MHEYSRFVRFLFLGRSAFQQLIVRHGLDKYIDPEDLFITSIVHLTDHVFLGKSLELFNLNYVNLPNEAWSNLMVTLFYSPPNNCLTNTLRENRHRNPFYKALFAALKEIDPFVAGTATLSISY